MLAVSPSAPFAKPVAAWGRFQVSGCRPTASKYVHCIAEPALSVAELCGQLGWLAMDLAPAGLRMASSIAVDPRLIFGGRSLGSYSGSLNRARRKRALFE